MSDLIRQQGQAMHFDKNAWVILNPIEQSIKAKIEAKGTPLKDWDISIYRGILTGCNEAFIISGEKRKELIAKDAKSVEIIRPILRGRDIKRYGYEFADLWLIATHNGYGDTPRVDINAYPAVKEHLDIYWKQIEKREDQGDTPYNLRCCAYMDDFSKQKIVYSEIVREAQFYLDKTGEFFVEATSFLMTGKHLEYLLKMFHSKLITFAFKTYYAGGGLGETGFRYKKAFFELLPVIIPTEEIEQRAAKIGQNDIKSKNDFIYDLYDLTAEERDFIDNQ